MLEFFQELYTFQVHQQKKFTLLFDGVPVTPIEVLVTFTDNSGHEEQNVINHLRFRFSLSWLVCSFLRARKNFGAGKKGGSKKTKRDIHEVEDIMFRKDVHLPGTMITSRELYLEKT